MEIGMIAQPGHEEIRHDTDVLVSNPVRRWIHYLTGSLLFVALKTLILFVPASDAHCPVQPRPRDVV